MSNIRHDSSHHWINNEEVDRQINEFSTSAKTDREVKSVLQMQKFYEDLQRRKDQGYNISAEEKEHLLMHRLNAASQHVHHERRWAERNEAALERKRVEERMDSLANKYREKRIDDLTYYDRHAKLKRKFDELGKKL